MLRARDWWWLVLLPVLAVVAIDQATKAWARGLTDLTDLGLLRIALLENHGFMLGSMSGASKLVTVVVPSAVGGMLVTVFLAVQYLLPLRSPVLRVGLSIFAAGVLGNVLDRALYGHVVDFLQLVAAGGGTGVFNVADVLQWVGVGVFAVGYVAAGRLLYPPEQRRGRKWLEPRFQSRFILVMLGVGVGFALMHGLLSYTLLRHLLGESAAAAAAQRDLIGDYLLVFAATTLTGAVGVALLALHLSHRIVGPIKGFENFLAGLVAGDTRRLKLRGTDELKHLEAVAERFYVQFHERLGLPATPLAAGAALPDFTATTATETTLSAADLLGRPAWIILYRYATCPLCAVHLDDVKATIRRVQAAGVRVVAVYESRPEDFRRQDAGATAALLSSMDITMVADPDRRLYRKLRSQESPYSILRPAMWLSFFKAMRRGYRQGEILGRFGQLPAHFLVDAQGVIVRAYYGKSFVDHIALGEVERFATGAADGQESGT